MFINANHIIQWLSKQPLRRCVLRALENGKVELLGGFKSIPPGSDPGFIVLVNSYPRNGCPGGRWVVAVVCRQNTNVYARVIPNIPWDQWDGKIDRKTIYDGDNPSAYAKERDRATLA
jgi:hypothetical protein